MEPIKKQGTFNVQGSEYILSMAATEESMYSSSLCRIVELESKYDAQMWRNTYTKQYIEDITQKTGSFKKFAIFASMLGSAISK
jgi:coiled-coil domain-containing protein 61